MAFSIPILAPARPAYPATAAVLAALTEQADGTWWERYLRAEDPTLQLTAGGVCGVAGSVTLPLATWSVGYVEALEVLAGRDLIPPAWMEEHPFWSPEGETPELPVLATVAALGAPTLATLQALVGEAAARYRPYGLDARAEIYWEVNSEPVRPGVFLKNERLEVGVDGVESRPEKHPSQWRRDVGPLSRIVRTGVRMAGATPRGFTLRIPPL